MTVQPLVDIRAPIPMKAVKVTKEKMIEEDCQLFGKRLLGSMEKCNVSQADLSRFMVVSRSAVNWWVQGITYPSIDNTKRIANYLRTTPEYLLFGVVHAAEERLVESIPVVNRVDGQQVEFTRITLPREFMARTHMNSKHLKALSIFSGDTGTIAIADTTDRNVTLKEPKMMVLDHDGKVEVGSVIRKKNDGDKIIFETDGRTVELPFDEKMIIGRLAATVQTIA